MIIKHTAFLYILLLNTAYSQDENTDTLEYKYPQDVIVIAPRLAIPLQHIPFAVSIVDSKVLRELPRSIAIDEPLKLIPGIKVDNQANGSRVHLSIRGQGILTERGIRGIKILLDEIPINDPTGFAPDFFDIDYNTVERIEVLRGPSASFYGGGASGGILNITTQNAPKDPIDAKLIVTAGSNNFWKAFGQFGSQISDINYRVSFSRTMGDGFRDHTRFYGNNIYAKATYEPSTLLRITPIIGWSNFYHENPEGISLSQYRQNARQANPDAVPFNEFLESNRTITGITGMISPANHHEIQFNGYVKRTYFTEANNRTFNHRTITTPGVSVQYALQTGESRDYFRNRFSIGVDMQWQTIDEHRTDNLHSIEGDTIRSKEQIKQNGTGLFVIDKIDFGARLGLMVSMRYDNIHNELDDLLKAPIDFSGHSNFSNTTGRIGITYALNNNMTLFASWGQGFLPPATEELAQNPDNFGGFNKHLVSATSTEYDLGSRGLMNNFVRYEITGFWLTTENDFDRYRIPDSLRAQETFYRNTGSSQRFGVEFSTDFIPISSLDLQISYTFSHFKYTNVTALKIVMDDPTIQKYILDGNWLPNSPQHQLCADLQYDISPDLSIGLSVEMLSKAYIDGANEDAEAVEGYTLLHGRIRYSVHIAKVNAELSFSVRNMTGKKYVAFSEPDPGGNSYQPGALREYFCGLRLHL
jgi:iron complex outermembrane receptor protein